MIIRIDYPQVAVRLDLWGGTSGTFAGLDQFNRVIDQRWQNNTSGTPADIDRYQYGYDRDSNRMWKANVVGTPIVTGGLDEYYTYDRVNRLNQMQRGTLNSTKTGITGTPSREMDWTLDPTGNWPGYLTKTSGTTDLDQGRTSSKVNEITNISESTGPTWVTPAYDAAGNMTTMPQVADPTLGFTATYDAWNRMTGISASGTQVAKYQYDGRNRRIVKETYTGGTLSETRHFYFTNAWQDVEERVGSSTSMDRQYAWGVRYVDELVCRDDAIPERLYACQDANYNVTAIADTSGSVQERFVYDPYGTDVVFDGSWSSTTDAYAWTCRFTGREYDSETQMYLYRRRFYHSLIGTFATRDPLMAYNSAEAINLFAYVMDNPITRLDPLGLACTVYFICSLLTSKASGIGNCDSQCDYSCTETSRTDSFGGTVLCSDVPSPATISDGQYVAGSLLCHLTKGSCGRKGTCAPSYNTSRVYMDNDFPGRDCSRSLCVTNCGTVQMIAKAAIGKLPPGTKQAAQAAAAAAYSVCVNGCNVWCKKP